MYSELFIVKYSCMNNCMCKIFACFSVAQWLYFMCLIFKRTKLFERKKFPLMVHTKALHTHPPPQNMEGGREGGS